MKKPPPPLTEKTLPLSAAQQISSALQILHRTQNGALSEELYQDICVQIFSLKHDERPLLLFSELARASGKTLFEIRQTFRGKKSQALPSAFDALVPQEGWLWDYLEWTRQTESPTAFHFFVAATVLGSTLARRVVFDKGAYKVFPNLCVMLIAPTGRCRKTSAANLGISLLTQTGGRLIADKATPEALIDSLKADATALIYAPELAVFLGKQKYQEGMIPLLTALLDCPKEWTTKTMGRGEVTLVNVGVSALMCSTIDWMQTAIPSDAFGGGFMSRFLFVVQEETGRLFALPPPMPAELKTSLTKRLAALRMVKAEAQLAPDAEEWYVSWYERRQAHRPADGHFAGYYERKPDHIFRLAMILAISVSPPAKGDKVLLLTLSLIQQAERILTWLEAWLPATFDRVDSSPAGEDQGRILRQLRQNVGCMDHSSLLRKNSSRLNAEQFRRAVMTLVEAGLVEWDKGKKSYFLTPEGWGA
jgi:hypothetical protein